MWRRSDLSVYKLGEEMRPELDGGSGPFHYALSEQDLTALNRQDDDCGLNPANNNLRIASPCRSGMQRFHIDAYGQLQLCSGNRTRSYDLRTGSFREGSSMRCRPSPVNGKRRNAGT